MKPTGIRPPTGEKLKKALARQRERRAASAGRYQAKRRGKGKRIRQRNPERRARLFEKHYHSEGFVDWVHSLGCSVPSCGATDIEAAHARAKNPGGTWEDVLPLCTRHHRMQHDMGIKSFERHVGFRLADVAASVHQRWLAFARRSA